MKVIAIDSSGLMASAAIVEDDTLVAEYNVQYKKTHSQTLLPMLDELKKMVELDLKTVDAIALAAGPGSFTGLRIGSATAKGLGLAMEVPLIEIPTLDGLACNLYGTDKLVCPIMDARRSQVYTGLYEFIKTEGVPFTYRLSPVMDQCAVSIDGIVEICSQKGREVIFLGDGVPVFAAGVLPPAAEKNCRHCHPQHPPAKLHLRGQHRPPGGHQRLWHRRYGGLLRRSKAEQPGHHLLHHPGQRLKRGYNL